MQADERGTWKENWEGVNDKIYVLKTSFLKSSFWFIRYVCLPTTQEICVLVCSSLSASLKCGWSIKLHWMVGSPSRWSGPERVLYGHLALNVIFIDMGPLKDCTLVGKPLQKYLGVLMQLALYRNVNKQDVRNSKGPLYLNVRNKLA